MPTQKLNVFPWSDSEESGDHALPCRLVCSGPPRETTRDPCEKQRCTDLDIRVVSEVLTAGKILSHCIQVVREIQQENGGKALSVIKIGLTSNPFVRRESYARQNFKSFVVIHQTSRADLLGMLEMLEAAVIAEFYDNGRQCRNQLRGGESMRDKNFVPRFPPPYYVYCAATNAAQREPILG